jgi:PKD domain/Proprotein convertase P-domain/Secretion system C-terminal sorting domain
VKRKIFIIATLSFFHLLNANCQTFTNTSGGIIVDNTFECFPVAVAGLPSSIDSVNFGLTTVCINIEHEYDANLDIYLRSPNGNQIRLVNNRGGSGRNFFGTCFREDASFSVINGVAPFPGNYIPEESLNLLNNLQNPNGNWFLCVQDEIPFNEGSLLNFSITFGPNPPRTPVVSICTLSNGAPCKCPDGSQNCDLLPDLTNSEKVIRVNNIEFPGELRIGVGTPNIGYGPLDVRGISECFCDATPVSCSITVCPDGHAPKQKVIQRVYKKQGANISSYDRPAGFMEFHPTHGHIHVENWTSNTLRTTGPDPDPSTWPVIGQDAKVSFCLVNLDNCTSNNGACVSNSQTIQYTQVGNPGLGVASGCGLVQGIFPGYLDIYYPGYDGQNIPLINLCNGWYNIVSITDPENNMLEMDETNNIAVYPIFLSQQQANCCQADFVADTLTGNAPFTVKFTDLGKPLNDRWLWDFGDGTTAINQFPQHTYLHPGVYDVTLNSKTKETNCENSKVKKNYIVVKDEATTANPFAINIYPNPFRGRFTVYYQIDSAMQVEINVFNILGQIVYNKPFGTQQAGVYQPLIEMPQLSGGFYIAEVKIGDSIRKVKLIQQ